MTDNEIIKALECCNKPVGSNSCVDCPLYEINNCSETMIIFSLDLINRQKAKIEALQMDNQQLQSDIANASMNLEHLQTEIEKHSDECLKCYAKGLSEGQAEIERLQINLRRSKTMLNYRVAQIDKLHAEIQRLQDEKDNLIETYKECSLEVVKDFAERLKEKSRYPMGTIYVEHMI